MRVFKQLHRRLREFDMSYTEIGQPEETLADLFPRRDIGRKR